jgi:hypothetical protein
MIIKKLKYLYNNAQSTRLGVFYIVCFQTVLEGGERMLLNKTKLKESMLNFSIELFGDFLMIAISLVIGYYVKISFLM